MALNKAVFRTRALSAVIFAVIVLAGLFWNYTSFLVLVSVIQIGCWAEYLGLIEKTNNCRAGFETKSFFIFPGFLLFLFIGMLPAGSFFLSTGKYAFSIEAAALAALFIVLIIAMIISKLYPLRAKLTALFGFLYISFSLGTFLQIKGDQLLPAGSEYLKFMLPVIIILAIWINDTMAYIVGSLIGKTPFSKISPKKTWEGTVGGVLLSIGIMALLGTFIGNIPIIYWIIIAGIASVAGTAGDLFESKLKRMAGVKDSGNIMPGHGGFLDRFDSLLFAAPAVWVFLKLLIYYR